MIREFLNDLKTRLSKEDFNMILEMTKADIKFNRTGFNKKTSPEEFVQICKRCCIALSRCN